MKINYNMKMLTKRFSSFVSVMTENVTTKLLLVLPITLLTCTLNTQAQQLWALTPEGGASNGGTIIRMNSDGSGLNVEFSYQCSMSSGCMPMGNLMQASNGQLYGTCFLGGQYASCTIDRYDPFTGTYYDIYDFDIVNGDYPRSGLIEAGNGKLYGVASTGGSGNSGVLYSIDLLTNAYTVEFTFSGSNGMFPWGCPVLKNGILYGLATGGGIFTDGVMYSFNIANNTYNVVHHFDEATGMTPKGSLFEASNGILYGLTSEGGSDGYGTLFSYNTATSSFTQLHSFYGTDGSEPEGTLMQAANGNLYGVTTSGGINNAGVLFCYYIATNACVKLYDFNAATGSNPTGNLYQSPDQKLYGSASNGGANNQGALFSYDLTAGTYTNIHNFNGTDGSHPAGGFVLVDITTGIAPLTQNSFSVYPNPVQEELNISFGATKRYSVKLTNASGQLLFSSENYSSQSAISTVRLPKGIYFIEVKEDNGKNTTQKVVKM